MGFKMVYDDWDDAINKHSYRNKDRTGNPLVQGLSWVAIKKFCVE